MQKYRFYLLLFIIILATSLFKSIAVMNYSISFIDESFIVVPALGFLDYDFNPRWFGYHTLPMYLLSICYFLLYHLYLALGVVSTKIEFVSLLFSNDSVFFITARLLASFAYTTGCVVLAVIILKNYRSKIGAVLFFLIAIFLNDAVLASNIIRVDTFVFLFFSLTVYFSCYSKKDFTSFLLSILFCAAAFASKITAIVLFPILFLKILHDTYNGLYPKKNILFFFLLSPIFVLIFMPYMVLDFDSYRPVIDIVLNMVSGDHIHFGKQRNYTVLSRFMALLKLLIEQCGIITVICSSLLAIVAVIKNRELLFPLIFTGIYLAAFSTSQQLDYYWLRPVYPFLLFFTFIFFFKIAENVSIPQVLQTIHKKWRVKKEHYVQIGLVIFTAYFFLFCHNGVRRFIVGVTVKEADSRILASTWIQNNIPQGSSFVLDKKSNYFPKIFSQNKSDHLDNSSGLIFLAFHFTKQNKLLMDGFDFYIDKYKHIYKNFEIIPQCWHGAEYELSKINLPIGSYVILSSSAHGRYLRKHVMLQFPELTSNARDFFNYIRSQKQEKIFEGSSSQKEPLELPLIHKSIEIPSGRGPRIEIYQIVTKPSPAALSGLNVL